MKKRCIALLHAGVILFAFAAPFILNWKWVLGMIALYYVQLWTIGGCILTKAEFGTVEEGFYYHYLRKLGFAVERKRVNFVVDYVIPPSLLLLAIFRQIVL